MYKTKPIIKSDTTVQYKHGYNGPFESVVALRAKLIEIFVDKFYKQTVTFAVGNFKGSQHSTIWLYTVSDLEVMNQKYIPREVNLLYDGNCEGIAVGEKKMNHSVAPQKTEEIIN